MRDTVLVIGSTCVDVLIRVEHLPRREDNLHPAGQRFMVGGCAYNVAQVLAQGRAELTYVTPVGMQGVFGPFLLPMLRALPWARPIALEDKENGCCYCLIEPDGERTFLSIHGAEYTFDPAWMEGLEQKHFDWCYVCGLDVEEPTGEALVDWLEAAPIGRLFYAPGPRIRLMPPERTQRLLALRPILHLNRAEALTLSGAETLEDAADFLYAETAQPVIIPSARRALPCGTAKASTLSRAVPSAMWWTPSAPGMPTPARFCLASPGVCPWKKQPPWPTRRQPER